MEPITADEIIDMIRHWLNCPPNGYIGSDYGCDLKSLLQQPQSSGLADAFVAKMHKDLPILDSWRGLVSVFFTNSGLDAKTLTISIEGLGSIESGSAY